jgi:hypothetical protein
LGFAVVLETPKGLKLKLNSTFRKIDPDVMSRNKHSDFGKILYALAHFHATIQASGRVFSLSGPNSLFPIHRSEENSPISAGTINTTLPSQTLMRAPSFSENFSRTLEREKSLGRASKSSWSR